ncbi:MAG: hypothetical protein LBP23_08505, partial [Treponema sp.]|nr:hypothetical protein [Treponema sp.]
GLPVRLVYKVRINPVWGKVKKNEESHGNLDAKPIVLGDPAGRYSRFQGGGVDGKGIVLIPVQKQFFSTS